MEKLFLGFASAFAIKASCRIFNVSSFLPCLVMPSVFFMSFIERVWVQDEVMSKVGTGKVDMGMYV